MLCNRLSCIIKIHIIHMHTRHCYCFHNWIFGCSHNNNPQWGENRDRNELMREVQSKNFFLSTPFLSHHVLLFLLLFFFLCLLVFPKSVCADMHFIILTILQLTSFFLHSFRQARSLQLSRKVLRILRIPTKWRFHLSRIT